MNRKAVKKGLLPYIFLLLIILSVLYFFNTMNKKVNVITFDQFIDYANKGEVTEIVIIPRERASVYEIKGILKDYEENEAFFKSSIS